MKIEKILSERDRSSIVKALRELLEELTDAGFIDLETKKVGLAFFPKCRALVLATGYSEFNLRNNRMIAHWGPGVRLQGGGNEELESLHLQQPIGEGADEYQTRYMQKMGDPGWVEAVGGNIRTRMLNELELERVADECIFAWESYEAAELD
ncbi:hypothetical protein SCB29_21510 [Paraburkholderia sp. SIMBA_055]